MANDNNKTNNNMEGVSATALTRSSTKHNSPQKHEAGAAADFALLWPPAIIPQTEKEISQRPKLIPPKLEEDLGGDKIKNQQEILPPVPLAKAMTMVKRLQAQITGYRRSKSTWRNHLAPRNAILKCLELQRHLSMQHLQEAKARLDGIRANKEGYHPRPIEQHDCQLTTITMVNPTKVMKTCSLQCRRDQLTLIDEEFANYDLASMETRMSMVEDMLADYNNRYQPHRFYKRTNLLCDNVIALNADKKKPQWKPRVVEAPGFQHIPSSIRTNYSKAWDRLAITRDESDRERELQLLELIQKDHFLLEMLREDAAVGQFQLGKMNFTEDFEESHNLVNRLLRLRKNQLDVDQIYIPEESLTSELSKEHRELLGRYQPQRLSQMIRYELFQVYQISADQLAEIPEDDLSEVSLTVDVDKLTYRDELASVLVQSSAGRDILREVVATLAEAELPAKVDQILTDIIQRLRSMIKQRYQTVVDLLLIPGLPQKDRVFNVTLSNWTKLEDICIPDYMRTFKLILYSTDNRDYYKLPSLHVLEFTQACKQMHAFSRKLLQTIEFYTLIKDTKSRQTNELLKNMTDKFSQEMEDIFLVKNQGRRTEPMLKVHHASVLRRECVLERSLREGSTILEGFKETLELISEATAVAVMTASQAIAEHPRNVTLGLVHGHLQLLSQPVISDVLNLKGMTLTISNQRVAVLAVKKDTIILKLHPRCSKRSKKCTLKYICRRTGWPWDKMPKYTANHGDFHTDFMIEECE